jgi:hypothetical protein
VKNLKSRKSSGAFKLICLAESSANIIDGAFGNTCCVVEEYFVKRIARFDRVWLATDTFDVGTVIGSTRSVAASQAKGRGGNKRNRGGFLGKVYVFGEVSIDIP